MLARAHGEVRAAEGKTAEAITFLRSALRAWQELAAPLAGRQARGRLAELLAADGDHEAAALELEGATAAFQQAGATRLLGGCEKLGRALKPEANRPRATSRHPSSSTSSR